MSEFSIKLKRVRKRCFDPMEKFFNIGEVTLCPNGMRYIYKDNGSNILAVAHLDSVRNPKRFSMISENGKEKVFVETVDDRLGAYIILDILPQLGIVPDILLTEGEEIGQSTARYFTPQKDYRWMFSFDREGTDVVMYDYENTSNIELMEEFGFVVGFGSFSDICYLDHLDISGFNFGTGYYKSHSKDAHFVIQDVKEQVIKFVKFHDAYKDTIIPFNPEPRINRYFRTNWSVWDGELGEYNKSEWKWDEYNATYDERIFEGDICPLCSGLLNQVFNQGNVVECQDCEQRFAYYFGEELEPIDTGDYCDNCYKATEFRNLIPIDSGYYVCGNCIDELNCCDFCGEMTREELEIIDNEYPICESCMDELYGGNHAKKV